MEQTLTIGMAHHNDYHGAYFTIQDIRKELIFNRRHDLLNKIEFVIVENDKNVMDIIEEPKAILAEAIKTYGPTPTQEQLDEVEKSRKSRAIWDAVQTLRTSTRMQQGGGRVLSTPTPVGLPSVQQMLE